ncbi:5'-AMP-activated protein kinase subunit beta-2-like [Watersipora subatra]|uniref:5'-AMP-activated protein kinase subunit beta-2-like n=1 Tax=Watersipora subatra TaxID=2589382 RepID=UPI00355C8284
MGNSHPGPSGTMSPTPSTGLQAHNNPPSNSHTNESYGIPIPGVRSDRFEQELNSSLSGISGLSAHMASRAAHSGLEGGLDFISPGQYITRLRANSVSVEPDLSHSLPVVSPALSAVIKWDKGGQEVSISGSFNKWSNKLPLVKSTDNFYTIVELEEGEHQYKYFVDGHWVINPDEPTITDCHGNLTNVIRVKKSDFEIVDALESDSVSAQGKADVSEYPQSEYGQQTPVRRPTDRKVGPPVLPQHLLQVIVNKDVAPHLESSFVPEPNHVMLNHLYALSIKDGVMVLSDTSRFRKKCVTTLLYKPID